MEVPTTPLGTYVLEHVEAQTAWEERAAAAEEEEEEEEGEDGDPGPQLTAVMTALYEAGGVPPASLY